MEQVLARVLAACEGAVTKYSGLEELPEGVEDFKALSLALLTNMARQDLEKLTEAVGDLTMR